MLMQIKPNIRMLFFIAALINLGFGIALSNAEQNDEFTAKQVVELFQEKLLEAMQLATYAERYEVLAKPVLSSHNLFFIVRVGISNQWKLLTKAQKQQLVTVFLRLAVAEYANNFKNFSGESFIFDVAKQVRQGVVVRMRFKTDDEEIIFNYSMKKIHNNWKIMFITVKGVNQSLVRAREYGSILRREGFDALINKINDKVAAYAKL